MGTDKLSGVSKVNNEFNTKSGANEVALTDLIPTQFTVGMREVDEKVKKLGSPAKLEKTLATKPIVVVLGPGGKPYVIDHHHLALTLLMMGKKTAPFEVKADFSKDSPQEFWKKMEDNHWVYPYDEAGARRRLEYLPQKITDLKNDDFRSLAWFVRKAGGIDKVDTPFTEFRWANYFRNCKGPDGQPVLDKQFVADHFDEAVKKALDLSQRPEAKDIPGYVSPELRAARAAAKSIAQSTKKSPPQPQAASAQS